ncbi:hypothetical protein EU513_14745 [Yimella sp. RIT 621]|uniref:hypothetical protein n=1 Tax=Yimella sp. RIT 621 TaxID=2510323 RepID=UPI00101CEEED|nr:hypothetical protein [Yimella sp. RIT 621]RYG75993.1 hypothetical protein EU513_14745 [Yimella sp. RIT 621]
MLTPDLGLALPTPVLLALGGQRGDQPGVASPFDRDEDEVRRGRVAPDGEPTYLVVELKQWTDARLFEDSDCVVSVPGYSRPVSHPVDQGRGYCEHLTDFAMSLRGNEGRVRGIAYLHNATDAGVRDLFAKPQDEFRRLVTGQRRGAFREPLRTTFAGASGAEAADQLTGSRVAPSNHLMALAAEEVQHREQFVLLDEQLNAYNYVLHCVNDARRRNTKTAVILFGNPRATRSSRHHAAQRKDPRS